MADKNVVVYRNGDPFFYGRKIVVNQRQFLTFEAFLNEVTRSIGAPLAVRNLYTPRQGHRVAELGDLQDGCQYVAAGFERFKSSPHALRYLLSPPFRLQLSRSTSLEWDTLLTTLTEKANLRSGAVHKLCRLDGTQVSGGEELMNGGYYVAVGTEKYKNLPYFELLVPQTSAYRTLWYVGRYFKSHLQEEESVFYAKPVPFLLLAEGVYKAKDPRKEMQGAQEVKEDEHTKVEVPIDQV
uniref:Doublecortin domain containing 2B n=1 Tax=Dromaius novaehollandiae TaxID=8790 RepID=A0A8C4JWS4_DRONO